VRGPKKTESYLSAVFKAVFDAPEHPLLTDVVPHELLPLSLLAAGQSGRVREIVAPRDEAHRLEEMGLRQGALVEIVQPGSPCIIRLEGQTICFRPGEAGHVLVETGASS
jgi:Fe2+ transport system protein FeoA